MTDCLVIGAGPAGSIAARQLAQQGITVTLLEQTDLAQRPHRAAGLSPGVRTWVALPWDEIIASQVSTVGFTWQQSDPVTTRLETEPMWMVDRAQFDPFLLNQAVAAGAQFEPQTTVTGLTQHQGQWQVQTERGTWSAPYLIAADGATGNCRQWLGFNPLKTSWAVTAWQPGTPPHPDRAQFDFGTLKNGFIWSFSTTVGTSLNGAIMTGKARAHQILEVLQRYHGEEALQTTAHAIAIWSGQQRLHTQNALLAGDCAGLADPLLVEGLRPAILSGVRAADAIAAALNGRETALAEYSDVIQAEWGSDMVWAQRLAGIFYQFPKLAYTLGVKQPIAVQLFGQILCGQRKYSEIIDRAVQAVKGAISPFR